MVDIVMNATRALGYMYIIFKNASIVLSCFRMRVYVCTLYSTAACILYYHHAGSPKNQLYSMQNYATFDFFA